MEVQNNQLLTYRPIDSLESFSFGGLLGHYIFEISLWGCKFMGQGDLQIPQKLIILQ